ncbi:hypothetical protein Y032_0477g2172 [Ancylostoma ceylanicum]|nr:hypothetical protein Y032_0477g2172 [Ancylostoma ceylanicum]
MLHNFFCGVTRIKGAQDELAVQPSCWPTWRGVLLLWCRRQFQILALYVGVANPWIVDPWTCGSKISAEFRELITDYHNSVRSKIAHGMERNHTGKLPSAKNMYEVVSVVLYGTCRRADEKISISQCTSYYIKAWDCELEKLAEKIAADEDFDLESIHPRAANIDHRYLLASFPRNPVDGMDEVIRKRVIGKVMCKKFEARPCISVRILKLSCKLIRHASVDYRLLMFPSRYVRRCIRICECVPH